MTICIRKGNDFLTYYELGQMGLHRAGHLYDTTPSTGMTVPYLPHFFLLMLPWAMLPFAIAAGLWFALKVGLLVYIARKFREWSMKYAPRVRAIHVVLPLVLCANYLNNDFRLGQTNIIVHALLVLSFVALSAQKHVLSGLLFVVSSFKVTPLFVLPYFIVKRQWKFLLAAAAWAIVICALLVAWFGWDETISAPGRLLELSQSYKLVSSEVGGVWNQSLVGVVTRIGIATGAHADDTSAGLVVYKRIAYALCALLLAGMCLWVFLRGSPGLERTEFAAFLVVMLLISPDTRSAHMVHLLLPAYLLVSAVRWDRFRLREHWPFVIITAIFIATSRDIVGRTVYDFALHYSLHTVVMLLFLGMLLFIPHHRDSCFRVD